MYRILFACCMAFGLGAQDAQPGPGKKSVAAPRPAAVPKEAEQVEPGLWKYKDGKGETWLYRRTPFGVAKYKPEDAAEAGESEAVGIRAFDEGENVRFERKTPFGVSKWTRKKSELAGGELAAWKLASTESRNPTNSKSDASTSAKGKQE